MQLPVFQRDITSKIKERLLEKRRFIQVIIGPRQVGKTTAVQQVLENLDFPFHYAAADLPAPPSLEWISQQWDVARMKIKEAQPVVLVLDEIQKISNWSVEVKRLWDEDSYRGSNILVVLLGSSALLIQKGLTESLAGRFEIIKLSHWSWRESRKCFNLTLDEFIYFGGYPAAIPLRTDEIRWGQYIRDSLIETAISKDILLLNRVEKPALLRQLFVLSCEYGGQILSYNKLIGQLVDAGNTTTLAHYQRLLETAFLIRGVQKWSGSPLRKRNSSPKWVPLNTALMTALTNKSFNEWRTNSHLWGRLAEVAVGAYLINEADNYGLGVYYWREGNYEVDFIVNKGSDLLLIEVKSGARRLSLPGINMFSERYKVFKSIVVGSAGIAIGDFFQAALIDWF